MTIYVGADHNGFALKAHLLSYLERSGHTVVDCGDAQPDSADDFPEFATNVVQAMRASDAAEPRGLLLCGSGQGMLMAANRFNGVRACLGYDVVAAHSSRNDDDANVLCLPATSLSETQAESITHEWLNTAFAGAARFKRRLNALDELSH